MKAVGAAGQAMDSAAIYRGQCVLIIDSDGFNGSYLAGAPVADCLD